MRAAILAVGDELLSPGRTETNSVFLTDRLASFGVRVRFRAVVPDDEEALAQATRYAVERADWVFVTGGLGPTADDLTRDAVARALSLSMSLDSSIVDRIERRFETRGIPMPEVNRRQAMVLSGADVLENLVGTAPGLLVPAGGLRRVVLLPGPPRELEPMFESQIAPRLQALAAGADAVYDVRKLWVTGLPESVVEERVGPVYRHVRNPATTVLASGGHIEIRLTASGATPDDARRVNEEMVAAMRPGLGRSLYSESEEPLEAIVGKLLLAQSKRISVAESLTGGLIADRLTNVPGASAYFDESYVTYSNEAKSRLLGVPSELFGTVGAVSEEVARAMASGALARAKSDIAVAVTGIAGPSGGSEDKPVGLVYIGLAESAGVRVARHVLPGTRTSIKRLTSQFALNAVRLALVGC